MNPKDTHKWKKIPPGTICTECGIYDPLEGKDATIDCTCDYGCEKCLYTGTILNPNLTIPVCPNSKENEVKS